MIVRNLAVKRVSSCHIITCKKTLRPLSATYEWQTSHHGRAADSHFFLDSQQIFGNGTTRVEFPHFIAPYRKSSVWEPSVRARTWKSTPLPLQLGLGRLAGEHSLQAVIVVGVGACGGVSVGVSVRRGLQGGAHIHDSGPAAAPTDHNNNRRRAMFCFFPPRQSEGNEGLMEGLKERKRGKQVYTRARGMRMSGS